MSSVVEDVFEQFSLRNLLKTLRASNEDLYLVGGAVRDALIGGRSRATDIDLMTSRQPEALVHLFFALGAPRVNRHGNFRFLLGDGRHLDLISTERFYGGAASVEEALNYFDASINALAISLRNGADLKDPIGGARDIANGQITLPFERWIPADPFEDVHVLLRAMRLISRTGFLVTNPELTIPHRMKFDEVDWTDLRRLNGVGRDEAQRHYQQIFEHVESLEPVPG